MARDEETRLPGNEPSELEGSEAPIQPSSDESEAEAPDEAALGGELATDEVAPLADGAIGGELVPVEAAAVAEAPRGLTPHLSRRWEIGIYAGLLILALLMRLWDLGADAIHHDESLHATYSWYLYQGRGYQHSPMMHGPFQFHANALIFFLAGDSDYTARVGYALFGTALVGLPWFLRAWLGRAGALITATLLAFSPSFLYYSRFARNDIIMAAWTLGMVIALWRYLREPRPRDLYMLAALLALAFATKETVYLSVVALGGFLFFLSIDDLMGLVKGEKRLSHFGPAGSLLVVMFTLSLPMGSALIAVAEGPLGMVLANDDPGQGLIGVPLDGAVYVAIIATAVTVALSAAIGLLWDWRRWLISAAIFYGIWILLYTTFFTNPFGIASGAWQSLGYWLAQQGVARGGQPWYYYIVIGWNYEFLPLLVGLAGAFWYSRRGDLFTRFLIFWTVAGFALFTVAAEKMPWLLLHLTLPVALLAGRTLANVADTLPWARIIRTRALLGVALVPLVLVFGYRLLFYAPGRVTLTGFLSLWGWLVVVFGLLALVLYLTTRVGRREGLTLAGLGVVAVLFMLTVRAGGIATYRNGDVPTEMLVYTQSSPDIARIAREIAEMEGSGAAPERLSIVVDGDDGFAWPWVWYLRDFEGVSYPGYGGSTPTPPEGPAVVLVNARNESNAAEPLSDGFVQVERYRHRWWFPESYRGITLSTLGRDIRDRATWKRAIDYWLFRDIGTDLGSVDAYLYYSTDVQP